MLHHVCEFLGQYIIYALGLPYINQHTKSEKREVPSFTNLKHNWGKFFT